MRYFHLLTFALLIGFSSDAQAGVIATYDLTFDGTNVTLDPGSDIPAGTSFLPGDSFELHLRTAGDNVWRVDAPYDNQFFPLTFFVLDSGDRTSDIDSAFFLGGSEVERITELSQAQSEVHIGAQVWTLPTGLEFDQISMTYDLLSSTSPSTVIQNAPDIFSSFGRPDFPFFRSPAISFGPGTPGEVPEPSTFAIFVSPILIGIVSRRKRRI